MKIDGMDWMDWLHRLRAESEEERRRTGVSRLDWLRQVEAEADAVEKELELLTATEARDRNADE